MFGSVQFVYRQRPLGVEGPLSCACGLGMGVLAGLAPASVGAANQEPMTVDEAARLGEEFGVIVGDVDEEIKKS